MALIFIERQQFTFQSRNEYQNCKKPGENCALIQDGDDVFIQFKQTSCDGSLLCDTDFGDAQLGNLVSNGDFLTDDAGWTSGAEWTYDSVGQEMDFLSAGPAPTLKQTIGAGLTNGGCYTIAFTIRNYVSGSITPSLGGTSGTLVNADGTYYQKIIAGAGGDFTFTPSGAGEYSITNIQLYYMGFCWCTDNGYMTANDHLMCHVPGLATTLTQVGVLPPTTNGKYYKISIDIQGQTDGFINVLLGTASTSNFEGNGHFVDYVVADASNAVSIYFDTLFDGCITNVIVEELATDIDLGVTDLDGNFVQELSVYLQFVEDYVIWAFDTTAFNFDYGCYRFWVAEPCDVAPEPQLSNCFNYKAEHTGSRQIIAIDRASTDPNSRYSFGFLWYVTQFYLVQRVFLNFRKPTNLTKSISDRYSTGTHYRSYAEISKRWELAIQSLDETQHDCLDIQTTCKSWTIDGVEYFRHDEEYTPLWDENGYNIAADVKLSVSRKSDVLFADNCNR